MAENKVSIFFSYSHKDEEFRDEIETHLALLHRNNIISSWHFRKITAGKEPVSEIDTAIKSADIILLLISSDFIASDYCYENELKTAMQRHEAHQAIIIPIIIRPTDWSQTPFSKLQCLPEGIKAVSTWENRDEAWLNVVNGVKDSIQEIHKLKNRSESSPGFQSMNELLSTEVDRIDETFDIEDKATYNGLPTGLADLDYNTDGLHESDLITIAGRPNMGKTDLVVNIVTNIAIREKRSVGYFSLNLPADRITRKLISNLCQIPVHKLLKGFVADDDWPRITSAIALLNDSPLYIDDSVSLSLEELQDRAKQVKADHHVELIIIDSLQHLISNSKDNIPYELEEKITSEIRILARELKIPIIVIIPISSDIENRLDKRPVISDLGKWRALEEHANTIIFLYRDEQYNYDTIYPNTNELILAKNSSYGKVGKVFTFYNAECCSYSDYIIEDSEFLNI